ncbi:MAG: hypothetical protein P1V97_15420, partial [Planctomycetota bacterium]|nr:hypothetical protein [Planctomycetota bacterium]
MARRPGKRALTLAGSSIVFGAVVVLFLPSVLGENSDLSFSAIQDLILGSSSTEVLQSDAHKEGHRASSVNAQGQGRSGQAKTSMKTSEGAVEDRDAVSPQNDRGRSHSLSQYEGSRKGSPTGSRRPLRGFDANTGRTAKEIKSGARASPKGVSQSSSTTSRPSDANDQSSDEDSEEEDDKPELGPTISTPIAGKLMNYQTRKGVSGASLQILVFHPLSTVPGAPQWVTATAANTNNDGSFSLNVEIPETPAAGAVLGLIFNHKDHTPVAGIPISSILAGKATNLGVFWLGGAPLTLQGTVTPAAIAASSALVDTGGLNPLAWDLRVRNTMLTLFPVYKPGQSDFNLSIGAQENDYENQRWMSLHSDGQWLGSQSAKFTQVDVERDGQTKKELIAEVNFVLGPD